MKIENIPVRSPAGSSKSGTKELSIALRDMEPGQSVVVENFSSNHRLVISVVQIVLDRRYKAAKTDNPKAYRIGRLD